jgi:hypothetical protein
VALAVFAVVALIASVAGGVWWYQSRSDTDKTAEVFLEAADDEGPDPFTENLSQPAAVPLRPVPARLASAVSSTTSAQTATTAGLAVSGSRQRGDAPGLYGGTGDNARCDTNQLISFLEDNQAKARAFADVEGITTAEIPSFIRSLTPVVLRSDTRVVNHGFRNGRATSRAAVLQAGTAVLVDRYGVPRVKCGCGNPLTAPTALSRPPRYVGRPWSGFSPPLVTIVDKHTEVNTFVLVNVDGGAPIQRDPGVPDSGVPTDSPITIDTVCDLYPQDCEPPEPPAEPPETTVPPDDTGVTLGTGDLQFTLRWSSSADLDLSVIDPTGATVSYGSPTGASGGQLDVDSNAGCNSTAAPVENIYWPAGTAPAGQYRVTVSYYAECSGGSGPQNFDLEVKQDGAPIAATPAAFHGQVSASSPVWTGQAPVLTPVVATSRVQQQGTLPAAGSTASFTVEKAPPLPPNSPPNAPTGVAATTGGNQATVTWTAPAAPADAPVTQYLVTVQPGGRQVAVTAPANQVVVDGLTSGTPYTFTVLAQNKNGSSPDSDLSAAVTPSRGEINPPTPPPTPPPTAPGTRRTGKLTNSTKKPEGNPAKGTPAAPTGVQLTTPTWLESPRTFSGLDADLSWVAPTDPGASPIEGWVIEGSRSDAGVDQFVTVDAPNGPTETEVRILNSFVGTKPPHTIELRVAARNAQGVGAFSAPVTVTLGCDVYGPGIGPSNMVRTLCEHDPLSR